MISVLKYFLLLTGFACSVKSQQQECGKPTFVSGLVVGGNYSVPGQWPWLASIFQVKGTREKYICGATLISDSFVITAAHCIQTKLSQPTLDASNTRIYLGRTNFSDPSEKFETRAASQIFVHPDWNYLVESFDADIAMIKFSQKVKFTKLIKPVCMPYESFNAFDFTGVIAGYGLSEHSIIRSEEKSAKHVKIPSVTQETCLLDYPEYARLASKRTFCGGEMGKIPCNGDSGSGFYFFNAQTSQFSIIGIVSASAQKDGKCDPDHFVVFSNVVKYLHWVYNKIPEITPVRAQPVWYSYRDYRIRRDVVFVQEGTVKAYVGRRWHESRLIVGKFIVEWNSFYMPYFGKELSFTDGDFELLEINGGYHWAPFDSHVPSNAIEGGREGSQKTYIGKVLHNGVELIGKIAENDKKIYVPYFNQELGFERNIQILVLD